MEILNLKINTIIKVYSRTMPTLFTNYRTDCLEVSLTIY
nr:MAG TPA: S1P4 First Extracellular Loop Peptidomimetic, helix-turn-helix, 3-10 helix, MEMBRANE [Caudoviricetes sp.]